MVAYKDRYKHYVDGDFEEHISNQRLIDGRSESWATEAEVVAAATRFSCEICILKVDGSRTEKLVFSPLSGSRVKHKAFLQLKNEHFNVLTFNFESSQKYTQVEEVIDWFDFSGRITDSHITVKEQVDRTHNSCFSDKPDRDIEGQGSKRNSIESKKCFTKKRNYFTGRKMEEKEKEKTIKTSRQEITVTNLSSRVLSSTELDVLSKGQSFIPTRRKIDAHKLLSDLLEWERRMRLTEFFHDKETDKEEEELFQVKKENRFTPEPGRDKCLDAYIKAVKNDIMNGLNNNIQTNMSKNEHIALRTLLDDTDIIIRPADKGSGLVVTDTKHYISGLEGEVKNGQGYRITDGKEQGKAEKKVKQLANRMHREGLITNGLREYLVPKHAVRGKLKGNPKIHKTNTPYRTIVSGIGSATERMAEVAEKELNAFVEESPSFIRDTGDFLQKLENGVGKRLPQGSIIFCFDVVKLYPSIPRKEGIDACKRALNERKMADIPTDSVLEMIGVVLDYNVFEFAGKEYTQTEGVAIGSRLGRNFACSYMRTWDEKLLENERLPIFYKRYIDDGIGVWTHGEEELMQFRNHANSIHTNIKVELRWSYSSIEFLDTTLRLTNGRIETDLYSKPTDKHQYVQAKSDHPSSVKKSIPYGLGIRLKRICSNEADYKKHREELKVQLRRRGYSSRFIDTQLTKVDNLNRQDLIQRKPKLSKKSKRVPLVVTYSKQLPQLHSIVRKHMDTLHRSDKMKEVFETVPMVAYRRDRNLGDILVHGKTNRVLNAHRQLQETRCQVSCIVCEMLSRGAHKRKQMEGVNFASQQECTAHNLVYGVFCGKCEKMVYVGETSRSLKERLKEHEADVRLERCKAMSEHFNNHGHSAKNIGVTVLETIKGTSRYLRLIREAEWIKTFKTEYPEGLNTKTQLDVLIRDCV